MKTALLLLNFGEPGEATPEAVLPFLERIFSNNAALEAHESEAAVRQRSQALAARRAPGLIADYERIGGSPLAAQAQGQAEALEAELARRGHPATVYVAYQFIDPSIAEVVARARAEGAEQLVALPYYPLCGFSTNVAALRDLRTAVADQGWDVPVHELSGWHYHPKFTALWVAEIKAAVSKAGGNLHEAGTLLYFSAHGTPVKYLEAGSRYDRYVEEVCRDIASALGGVAYTLGYQNHANRGIAWTAPDNADHLQTLTAERLVVVPISFLREQSETLSELDLDFREAVVARGMDFVRVPVPHAAPLLTGLVADLVAPFITDAMPKTAGLFPCLCRPGAFCTNGHREV